MSLFENRRHGGRELARTLARTPLPDDAVVLGLARGGLPVAFEIARILELELDVFLVRKLGAPGQPELAIGAIATGGIQFLNERLIGLLNLSSRQIQEVISKESRELSRRETLYRGDRPPKNLTGRTVLLVDDGIATGASVTAAIEAVKKQHPAEVIVAVPVAPRETADEIAEKVDHLVCLTTPHPFYGVGAWYDDFSQTTDEEVRDLLDASYPSKAGDDLDAERGNFLVDVEAGATCLQGHLQIPRDAESLVLFAHGSGSSRFSPRNRHVAAVLREFGLATLLIDLLTPQEEDLDQYTRHLRFDIDLLTRRLVDSIDWLILNPETQGFKIGLFGSSTGAAAALHAAARRPDAVRAVVSRGGRVDLASDALPDVFAPTLFIVGSRDASLVPLNEEALRSLGSHQKRMELISGATHLFSEPGALEEVALKAGRWFRRFLARGEALPSEERPHP